MKIIKKAIGNLEGHCEGSYGVKVLEPKSFNCTCNAKELKNFL